jgi:hypothetical protein
MQKTDLILRIQQPGFDSYRVTEYIETFCRNQIRRNDAQIALIKINGWRALRLIGLFLIPGLIAVSLIARVLAVSSQSSLVVGGILTVIAWVVLWRPVESVIYDWRSLKVHNDLYRAIMKLKIQVIQG